jgi:ribonuclease BN (tRNA processing enzyme)
MCGTASGGSTKGAGANILLEAAGQRLLLDCGHSSVNGLMQALGPTDAIDALLFSHLHFDHVVGLPELLCRFALEGRAWPRIFGPRDTATYAAESVALARTLSRNPARQLPADPVVDEGGPGDAITIGDVRVSSVEVPHVAHLQCLARRFDWDGGALVYSGDTSDAPEVMVPFAAGADVLIHEAYSSAALERTVAGRPERVAEAVRRTTQTTHSRVETVGRVARDAGVRTLILTHLLPEEDAGALAGLAAETFKGAVFVARDGLIVEP